MSLPLPPGILLGTRGKLSELRTVENLQRGAGAAELRRSWCRSVCNLCMRLSLPDSEAVRGEKTEQRKMKDWKKQMGRKAGWMRVLIYLTRGLISEPNCRSLNGLNETSAWGQTNTLRAQKHLLVLGCSLTENLIQHNKHKCSPCHFSNAWVQSLIDLHGNTLMACRAAHRPSLFAHGRHYCTRSTSTALH